MKTDTTERQLTEQPLTDQPITISDDYRHYQETSHVFYCMQCDLHFQTDVAVVRRNGSHESEEERIRVRLDPHTALQQHTGSIQSRVVEREVDRAKHEGEEGTSC